MPKPLCQVRPSCSYHLNNVGDYPLREREPLARAAMEGIASFSTVESWMLNLYLDFAGGNKTVAAAMFLKIESRSARSAVLQPLIAMLPEHHQRLYRAIDFLLKKRAKARDRLAHWVWGSSHELPNALLLANPRALATIDPFDTHYQYRMNREIWVYEASDFAEIIEANNELAGFCFKFRWIVQAHSANAGDRLYHQLCEEPVLADILRRQDKRDQSQRAATE